MDYRSIDLKVRISICRGEHTTEKINGTSLFSIFSSPELLYLIEPPSFASSHVKVYKEKTSHCTPSQGCTVDRCQKNGDRSSGQSVIFPDPNTRGQVHQLRSITSYKAMFYNRRIQYPSLSNQFLILYILSMSPTVPDWTMTAPLSTFETAQFLPRGHDVIHYTTVLTLVNLLYHWISGVGRSEATLDPRVSFPIELGPSSTDASSSHHRILLFYFTYPFFHQLLLSCKQGRLVFVIQSK